MDGQRGRLRIDREPHGFLPRAGIRPRPWRRVRDWLFSDRADIDQEGLLAGRTLLVAPPRPAAEDGARARRHEARH